MKRTTRNAVKTKQEIIEKSAPVFNVNGFAGTSMQMLVQATGYQMGGIYRHFDTKMDLAKAVFKYNYQTLVQPNIDVDLALSPQEKLLAIFENYKKMVIHPIIKGGCPILNTSTEVDDTNREFSQLVKSFVHEILQTIELILEEGINDGSFQSTVDPKKDARFLYSSFQGAILIGNLTKDLNTFMDVFDRIAFFLENNIFRSSN